MPKGIYKRKKFTKAHKLHLKLAILDNYKSGMKIGFQPGHKIRLGMHHSKASKELMKNARLGCKYRIVKPKKLLKKITKYDKTNKRKSK